MSFPRKLFYQFGPFRLNLQQHLLLRDGEVVPLPPKAIDLLVVLLENSGNVLDKEELMKQVWPDTFVEEGNLSRHIFSLRKALGEGSDGGYIETIPRRGYRFVAGVTEVQYESDELVLAEHFSSRLVIEENQTEEASDQGCLESSSKGRTLTTNQQQERRSGTKRFSLLLISCLALIGLGVALYFWISGRSKPEQTGLKVQSIAILPFKPLVADGRDEYLEMGMAETLITRLSNLREIVVRPTSAVRKYTDLQQDAVEAGRELQVEAVLDASIQKSDDRLRVVARLVRIKDGATLWADKFDERFTNIFAVQDRISERLTAALALRLTGEERKHLAKRYTENVEAYQLYMRGRLFWSRFTDDGLKKSIGLYEQAIEIDPDYALAYAGLANTYNVLGVNGHMHPKDVRPKAQYAAEKALELNDNLAQAHQALAGCKLFYAWDWAGAEREFKRAMELDPSLMEAHEVYSYLLNEQGRFDEAFEELRKAQELNPVAISISGSYGDRLRQAHQYDQAIEFSSKTLEMVPDDFYLRYILGWAYAQNGMYEKAVNELNKAVTLSGNSTRMLSGLGQVYGLSGKKAEAQKVIAELQKQSKQRYVSPLYIAMVYATLGEKDRAFLWLEKAYEDHAPWLVELGIEPSWDKIRSDPRFDNLRGRVGLPK